MARNIEFKARLVNFAAAQQTAGELADHPLKRQRQVDTYFRCCRGRLKLREIAADSAQLIAYRRANTAAARPSDYHLVEISDPASLRKALAESLGILGVVEKEREIYLHRNVRIHLDRVENLGDFLEFEAVLSAGELDSPSERLVAELVERFDAMLGEPVESSYSDLLFAGQL